MKSLLNIGTLLLAARARRREQWYPPERLRELRLARLRHLVWVAGTTPYYGELFARLGFGPGHLTDETMLERLPVLEKPVLQDERGTNLLTRPADQLFPIATSGSTGQPLRLLRSHRDQAQISAQWARLFHAYGRRTFDRQVNIGSGQTLAKRGPVVTLRKLGILPTLHHLAGFDPPDRQIALLRRVRPDMISAFAVGLELLGEAVLEAGLTDIRPRIVYSTGMVLTPRCRTLVRQAFGVEPYDVYAANEVGPIAWECPVRRGVLHLNDDVQITEIVDDEGHPVPDGALGEVVVTQLLCTAQPLIRYRIGDLASRRPGLCGCGRGLGLMESVEGRTRHIIRSPDGRRFLVQAMLSGAPEVRRYQVRETAPGELRILVVPSASWREGSEAAVRALFVERLGEAFRFEVERVDDIPLAPSGKFQTIVPLEPAERVIGSERAKS